MSPAAEPASGIRFSQLIAEVARRAPESLGGGATSPLLGGGPVDPLISAVVQRHDQVGPGALFVARRGEKFDAHRFLSQAVAAGAVALVGEVPVSQLPPGLGVPYLMVPDARRVLAPLAAALYRYPSEALAVFGVTGTDGKTTTSYLLHHLLALDGTVGLVSTAGNRVGDSELALEGHFTTPEANDVQRLLAAMRDAGARRVVLESSSHGLSLGRLDAVAYQLGVVTNLSPEHLDHHRSMAAYLEAKLELVRRAPHAVLNRDDAAYDAFAGAAAGEVTSYGEHPSADLRIAGITARPGSLELELVESGRRLTARLPMVGRYNAWNAVAALAAARLAGVPFAQAAKHLANFGGVPGRMQVVQAEPFSLIVDFAHTPAALAKALEAARPSGGGRLIVVIGAAGERDTGKRAGLGSTAASSADLAVFTEEDSRSEATSAILAQLAAGANSAGGQVGSSYWLVADRREAIHKAVSLARAGDVVVLAGKGHERTLERADETLAWDEAAVALEALRSHPGARTNMER